MSRYVSRLIVVGIFFLPCLSACGLLSKSLMPDNTLLLMAPELGPEQGVLQQKVTLVREGKSQTFVVVTEISKQSMRVAVLMPTGQRVLTMKYDGQTFESTNYTDIVIPAQEVFSLMQFAIWPVKALDVYYSEQSGWQTSFLPQQRLLFKHQQAILKMQLKPNQTQVHHLLHQYQVIIQPLVSP